MVILSNKGLGLSPAGFLRSVSVLILAARHAMPHLCPDCCRLSDRRGHCRQLPNRASESVRADTPANRP